MPSSRRRCTGSSSTIRINSAMGAPVVPIWGAPWRNRLNTLLSVGRCGGCSHGVERGRVPTMFEPDTEESMPPARSRSKSVAKPASAKPAKSPGLGDLPHWNLTDLYPAPDAGEVKRDLDRADADSIAF